MGHTHMPFDRLVDGRRAVNPGSVGMSYGAARCLLGAARTGRQLRPHGVRRRGGGRADPAGGHAGRGGLGAASTSSAQYGDAEALEAFTELVDPCGPHRFVGGATGCVGSGLCPGVALSFGYDLRCWTRCSHLEPDLAASLDAELGLLGLLGTRRVGGVGGGRGGFGAAGRRSRLAVGLLADVDPYAFGRGMRGSI